jgi:PAN domain-containing protein
MTNGLLRICVPAALMALAVFAVPQAASGQGAAHMTVEKNTDRPGGDYRTFALTRPQANDCRMACLADTQCRAYTYVNPGIQGPQARCWLKSVMPAKVSRSWAESGVKVGG